MWSPLANERAGSSGYFPIRGLIRRMSQSDQWSQMWWPSSGASHQTWGHLWPNTRSNNQLMNVGSPPGISHWYGHGWLLYKSSDKYFYCQSPDIVCIFPPSLTIEIPCLFNVLRSMVYSDGWCLVWWGNENGLCDIQSDKNMGFWKMKYETAYVPLAPHCGQTSSLCSSVICNALTNEHLKKNKPCKNYWYLFSV